MYPSAVKSAVAMAGMAAAAGMLAEGTFIRTAMLTSSMVVLIGCAILRLNKGSAPTSNLEEDINRPFPLLHRIVQHIVDFAIRTFPSLSPKKDSHYFVKLAQRTNPLVQEELPAEMKSSLDVLCQSFENDTNLSWTGRLGMEGVVYTSISGYFTLQQILQMCPNLSSVPLDGITFIVGFPRSGTTFLHRLLSLSEAFRTIPLWELLAPMPLDDALRRSLQHDGKYNTQWKWRVRRFFDTLVRQVRSRLHLLPWRWIANHFGLDAIHYIRPSEPDECNFAMRYALAGPFFWDSAPVLSFQSFLDDPSNPSPMEFSYRTYRRLLQFIQSNSPGQTLLLKYPWHAIHLKTLMKVFPEANIIIPHRDLSEGLPSSLSLSCRAQAINTRAGTLNWKKTIQTDLVRHKATARNLVEIARLQGEKGKGKVMSNGDHKAAEDVNGGTVGTNGNHVNGVNPPPLVFHLSYSQIVDSPLDVVRHLHSQLHLPLTDVAVQRMQSYCQSNRQHKFGVHRHSFEGIGVDPNIIQRDEDFKLYMDTFRQYF